MLYNPKTNIKQIQVSFCWARNFWLFAENREPARTTLVTSVAKIAGLSLAETPLQSFFFDASKFGV